MGRGQDPAYRATLLFICFVTHTAERDMRKNFVEVFARVRVDLQLLKGKIAGKRAEKRAERVLIRSNYPNCIYGLIGFICQPEGLVLGHGDKLQGESI